MTEKKVQEEWVFDKINLFVETHLRIFDTYYCWLVDDQI